MSDFVTLACPSCGGKLQITDDIDRFACAYCGTEHIVKRGGGLIVLSPVLDGIQQVRKSVDKTASELATRRLSDEMAVLENEIRKAVSSTSWSYGCAGIVFAVMAFVLLRSFLDTISGEFSCLISLVGAALVMSMVLVLSSKEIKKRCASLDQAIGQKLMDLEQHREIVAK